jgi:hydrogenase expression/formation protein HypC
VTREGPALHCVTCSDEGIEMTVVELTQCGAQCRDRDGADQRIEIELVEPVMVGDVLLVHAGVAIANLGCDSDRGSAER